MLGDGWKSSCQHQCVLEHPSSPPLIIARTKIPLSFHNSQYLALLPQTLHTSASTSLTFFLMHQFSLRLRYTSLEPFLHYFMIKETLAIFHRLRIREGYAVGSYTNGNWSKEDISTAKRGLSKLWSPEFLESIEPQPPKTSQILREGLAGFVRTEGYPPAAVHGTFVAEGREGRVHFRCYGNSESPSRGFVREYLREVG
ncbi:hypothetical protein MKZ38_006303 [Zalerion maritima]|uniref:Uncharacterized protein n=1 Tax=Zalerion maritima TaxID=339359 RepID=A0AAD5RJ22_9PEZI|nr:hypothetical protein MKZ38_006303 [Zalerion maritima]